MINGNWAIFCWGAKHTWIGTLTYSGYTFASDANQPLQFVVDQYKGYVYVGGTGTVTSPDGKTVSLGNGQAVEPTEAVGSPTEESNWAVNFEFPIPVSKWSLGAHQYILTAACPSFPDFNKVFTYSFQVSDSTTLFPDPIYFRLSGLVNYADIGATVDSINPAQTTIAAWTVQDATRSEIDQVLADCRVSISWDGGSPNMLVAHDPYQR